MLMFLLASALLADQPAPGQNLLPNPGFEAGLASWSVIGEAPAVSLDTVVRRGGGQSLRLSLPPEGYEDGFLAARQMLIFDPPLTGALRVAGWARAEDARVAQNFCIYVDAWHDDGTPLWGQNAVWPGGTHEWRRVVYEFIPTRPIARMEVFAMLRRAGGTVWFDDLEVCRAPLDWLEFDPRLGLYGGQSLSLDALLSRPAAWSARLTDGAAVLATAEGRGAAVGLEWRGTAANAVLAVDATDEVTGETVGTRQALPLPRAGAPRDLLLGTADSQARVLPSQPPTGAADAVALDLARGEAESAQLTLRAAPGTAYRDLRLEAEPLVGPRGATLAAPEWQQVGYVWLDHLQPHPADPGARAGWWPDPLLPVDRFDLDPGFTQALWVTVRAPAGQAPGEYSGALRLVGPAGELHRVALTVTVHPFTLPTRPSLKTAFALMDGFLERVYGRERLPEIRRRYGDFVLDHRLAVDDISRTDPPDLDDLRAWDDRQSYFNVLNLVEQRGDAAWRCWSELDWYTPEHLAELEARLADYVPRMRAAGLEAPAYVYTFDERGEEFYPTIREVFGMVRERFGLRTFSTARVPQDPDVLSDLQIDAICPLTPGYDREAADRCRAAGHEVWAYVCLGPRYPNANFLADHPLVESRVIWWQAFDQRVDGFLLWGLNIWDLAGNDRPLDLTAGPRVDWSITTGGEYAWLHGDGRLLYAGPDGPVGSVRLANIRDGLEDYEYLRLATERDPAAAAAVLARITTGWSDFSREPDAVRAARAELAQIIGAE